MEQSVGFAYNDYCTLLTAQGFYLFPSNIGTPRLVVVYRFFGVKRVEGADQRYNE